MRSAAEPERAKDMDVWRERPGAGRPDYDRISGAGRMAPRPRPAGIAHNAADR